MKILFDNLLESATFSSVNASANYPVSNLVDGFLRVRYQAAATTDSIEITPTSAITMNSFYLGYIGNVSSITLRVFSGDELRTVALGAEHGTGETDTVRVDSTGGAIMHFGAGATDFFEDYDGALQFVSAHFPAISGVDRILIDLVGSDPFYVGGMAGGLAVEPPSPDAAWQDDQVNRSPVVRSPHGQVQQLYIEPYKQFLFTFNGATFAEFSAIKAGAMAVGSHPVWVTFFEDSPTDYPPGYYTMSLGSPQRERRLYRFTLNFEEAR